MDNYVFCLIVCFGLMSTILHCANGKLPRRSRLPTDSEAFNESQIEEWHLEPWLSDDIKLGQVSGVSVDPDDNIYLFHRGNIVWDATSFTDEDVYTGKDLGPISQPTILIFSPNGTLLRQLGKKMFYMPHGITVDGDYNIWVTDVALHQVMKLSPSGNQTSLILGEKFVPGNVGKFCKPTSVAVMTNGDFFIADGYCNSRILKYNKEGVKILEWGRADSSYHPPGMYDLNIPHALTLAEDKGLVCTADRENGRVVCYRIDNGKFVFQLSSKYLGNRIFSVAYSSLSDGKFFIVNGESREMNVPVRGLVLENPNKKQEVGPLQVTYGKIVGKFGDGLKTPHDVAVSANGNNIYVAEIGPYKAWKYVRGNSYSSSAPSVLPSPSNDEKIYTESVEKVEGLTGAVLVTISCFIFAIGLIMAVLIYSKSRRSSSADSRRLLSNVDF